MRLNRLETHDRLIHLHKDLGQTIAQGAEDCLKRNPDSIALQEKSPYIYLFAHPRTADDGVTKRMLWQPRLSKPKAEPNSYLFRAISKTDIMEICWMIPPKEMWAQYSKGNVTESEFVFWSIQQYEFNRHELEAPDPKDLPEHVCEHIWRGIINEIRQEKLRNNLFMPMTSAEFLPFSALKI